MKKILLIKAHTRENSFCHALADEYKKGAEKAGHQVKVLTLSHLDLERFIKWKHEKKPEIKDDLLLAQNSITWADHLVFAYPTWWATMPALLKVFLEIVLQSGFAYKYQKPKGPIPTWDKLLKGKSARLIVTMDSPAWYYKYFLKDPGYKTMKDILNFCGVKMIGKNYFGSIKMSSEQKRKNYLQKIYQIGLNENNI